MAQYPLEVPDSLMAYAREVAQEEQVSMNQFFVTAIAEKVSALKTESYFKERLARANAAAQSPDAAPLAGFGAWLATSPATAAGKDDQF